MSLQGIVESGVIVLQDGQRLDDGTVVEVIVKAAPPTPGQPDRAGLLELAGAVDDWPEDMARNHDHYLHGAPKR